ncbi:uncharacterized protein LOC129876827 [Solanum dulcamara]|uniref:uncharacterized protein LOC129876827 n=1 Tax=Solanum dulcamara TaxID=45834 RepID=UPI0024853CC0|nr:uncharacterized protein LOC129876827 [Solanum dulcamara]
MVNGDTAEGLNGANGFTHTTSLPIIDHNHPLFLQPTNTPGISKGPFPSSYSGGTSGGHSSTGGSYNGNPSTSGGNYKARKSFLQCEHCGCKVHSKGQCYKIVGYPADFKSKKKSLNSRAYVNNVEFSQSTGQELKVNNCQGQSVSNPHHGAFFTQNQYQPILHLLSKTSGVNEAEPPAKVATADAGSSLRAF